MPSSRCCYFATQHLGSNYGSWCLLGWWSCCYSAWKLRSWWAVWCHIGCFTTAVVNDPLTAIPRAHQLDLYFIKSSKSDCWLKSHLLNSSSKFECYCLKQDFDFAQNAVDLQLDHFSSIGWCLTGLSSIAVGCYSRFTKWTFFFLCWWIYSDFDFILIFHLPIRSQHQLVDF